MSQFQFKQFTINQSRNAQKIGTDSMLLGAWTKGEFTRILDIGTGTGILALMIAQKNPTASITAIEPVKENFEEATENFKRSVFNHQILSIQSPLQQFGSMEKFDLIICNPPYFNGSYLSASPTKNQARHQTELTTFELYEHASELLTENGKFNLIIPYTELEEHLHRAFDAELYLQEILLTIDPKGQAKRALLSFGFDDVAPIESQMSVKNEFNQYSEEYIQLTKEFYQKDLSK